MASSLVIKSLYITTIISLSSHHHCNHRSSLCRKTERDNENDAEIHGEKIAPERFRFPLAAMHLIDVSDGFRQGHRRVSGEASAVWLHSAAVFRPLRRWSPQQKEGVPQPFHASPLPKAGNVFLDWFRFFFWSIVYESPDFFLWSSSEYSVVMMESIKYNYKLILNLFFVFICSQCHVAMSGLIHNTGHVPSYVKHWPCPVSWWPWIVKKNY